MSDLSVEEAVGTLARNVLPTVQAVRAEPHRIPPIGIGISDLWMVITQAILHDPALAEAEQAARADSVLGPAVTSRREYIETSFSSAGPFEATTLPVDLIEVACFELLVRGLDLTPDSLARCVTQNVRKLRAALQGAEIESWCVIAFGALPSQTGILVQTPWGDLVAADRLTGEIWNDPPYRCTVVLATPAPMKLVPMTPDQMPTPAFPVNTHRIGQLVSYGIALGSNRQDPTTAVPLHAGGLPPWGMHGWGGELRESGFGRRSTPLSSEEGQEAAGWMTDLDGVKIARIEIGLRRLVRSLAERHDAGDQLVDAVIAWENLVEHRSQPTSSVIWGIKHLAGPSGWSKTRINSIYEVRSDVVHGEEPDYSRVRDYAPQALQIGLDALRNLLRQHRDTLAMSSEERITALGYHLPQPR